MVQPHELAKHLAENSAVLAAKVRDRLEVRRHLTKHNLEILAPSILEPAQ